ncbi:hypothetical protein L6164_006847 [Bauhinia variegata]|uniref:Uncharacterized protein n=1 Tax=Bauhinia variegata TaxID=167791 RepID=A0ACB9PVI6_BAUVA|nr:hypothetical protein L6164_006847 [Bauhinia variegata]
MLLPGNGLYEDVGFGQFAAKSSRRHTKVLAAVLPVTLRKESFGIFFLIIQHLNWRANYKDFINELQRTTFKSSRETISNEWFLDTRHT